MSGPFKMRGSPFQRNFKLNIGKGQGSKRKGKYTVDPDAPGYKYGPGYEPPVSEEDKNSPAKQKTHPKHPVTPPTKEEGKKSKGTLTEVDWLGRKPSVSEESALEGMRRIVREERENKTKTK